MTTLVEPVAAGVSEPMRSEDLGIEAGILRDLTLKTMYHKGRCTRAALADALKVSGAIAHEMLQLFTSEGLGTVTGASDKRGGRYLYALTEKGLQRAEGAISRSGYVGPVPVPLHEYIANVRATSVRNLLLTREQFVRALHPLVLSEQTVTQLVRAASSRRSMLVYGPSGNGKTTLVRRIASAIGGSVPIPYAVEAYGQIIRLFDASKHEPVEPDDDVMPDDLLRSRPDRRWLHIRRPVIWAGGELARRSLELVYDDATKVYEAPLQLKANGGTLIIDDFGRQQIPAVQLLNRWIVALEASIDHLTMHTGQLMEVPFDVLVEFSTNLAPDRLADDAFLRRIRYKIEIPNPSGDEYRGIMRRACEDVDIPFDDEAVSYLLERWYGAGRELRGCHPRDIVDAIVDASSCDGSPLELSKDVLDDVCATYFLHPATAAK